MAEVTNWDAPARIYWEETSASLRSTTESTIITVGEAGVPYNRDAVSNPGLLYIGFYSTWNTFQLQYRRRRRYTPAAQLAATGSVNGEMWEDWSDWITDASIDISGQADTSSGTTKTDMGNLQVWDGIGTFTFEYDWETTGFDKQEFEVRARTYDEPSDTCSAWTVQTLTIGYTPLFTCTAASENMTTGNLDLSLSTNWERGGVNANFIGRAQTKYLFKANVAAYFGALRTECALAVDKSKVNWSMLRSGTSKATVHASKDEGGGSSITYCNFTLNNATPSTSVGAPAYYVDGNYLEVSLIDPSTTKAYTGLFASFSWVDADGVECTASLIADDALKQNKGGFKSYNAYDLGVLPYDVNVEIRIVGAYNGKWNETLVNYSVESGGRCTWIGEDGTTASLVLRLNEPITISRKFSPEQETVKLAGRTREVSRYGTGGSMSLDLEGAILLDSLEPKNADIDASDHAPFFQELTANKQDFTFLAPRGMRARVQVNSVSFETHRDYETVQISMSEVE